MRTSLVFMDWNNRPKRACIPAECVPSDSGIMSVPRYSPASPATGTRTNPRTGKLQKKWIEPQSVHTYQNVFHPKGGKLERIRMLPEGVVEALEKIDVQRAALQEAINKLGVQERELLAASYPQSRIVTLDEIKAWTEEEKKAKEAQPKQ